MPEFWGRDSPYHGGTEFLGTPRNHLDVSVCVCLVERKDNQEGVIIFLPTPPSHLTHN